MSLDRNHILITLCGAALMMTQYVAVREIGSTFFSTEVVTLIAVVIYLVGPVAAKNSAASTRERRQRLSSRSSRGFDAENRERVGCDQPDGPLPAP
jgi:hypothetical protein